MQDPPSSAPITIAEYNLKTDDFVPLKQLGAGGFSSTFLAKWKVKDQPFAIKVLDLSGLDMEVHHLVKRQLKIHAGLVHPFILDFYNVFYDEDRYICMVLEWCSEGDLYQALFQRPRVLLSQDTVRKYSHQLVSAVGYLHSLQIAHRDIKPENILIQQDGSIRLADFGCATTFSDSLTSKSFIGTMDYFGPQVRQFQRGKRQSYPVAAQDVWALGVVIYEMWNSAKFKKTSRILWRRIPPEDLQNLIEGIILGDEHSRPSIQEVLNHRFFQRKSASERKTHLQ